MDIAARAIGAFFLIVILARLAGRRQVSEMQPIDLVLFVVVGDLVQQAVTQSDYSLTGAIVALGTFLVLVVAMQYGIFRWAFVRRVLEGEPIVVVEDGEVIAPNLHRLRLSVVDLAEHMRLDGIGSLDEIRWAIVEASGDISFVRRDGSHLQAQN